MAGTRRLAECVAAWPDAEAGGYDPRCCRFPKSCSPYPYPEQIAAGVVALESPELPKPGSDVSTIGGPVTAVIEQVARALAQSDALEAAGPTAPDLWDDASSAVRREYRRLAAAAVAAYRATQNDGAEEAVRRVEALCETRSRSRGFVMLGIDEVRAALAPQAEDGAR